jgi:hypothetical protein
MTIKRVITAGVLAVLVGISSGSLAETFATCVGADPCRACKNCKYCGYCATRGGTCGVCKKKTPKASDTTAT